jgi:putative inorganic carbon (hco3(-)) transporter
MPAYEWRGGVNDSRECRPASSYLCHIIAVVVARTRWGGSASTDRLLVALLVTAIVGVPTFVFPGSLRVFVVPQVVLLWTVAVAVLLVGLYRIAVTGRVERGPVALSVASVSFLIALAVTSVLSSQPWVALTGLTVRGAGAVTYGLCVGLLHAVFRLGRRRSLEPLVLAFVVAHVVVVAYALIQAFGADPISWEVGLDIFYGPVFSTLGNPNFSAGFVAMTMPLLVWVPFGSACRPVVKVGAGAMIGASVTALAYLGTFQGYVTALVAVSVLVNWALFGRSSGRPLAVLVVLPVAVVVGGLPILATAPGIGILVGVAALLAACSMLAIKVDMHGPSVVGSDRSWNTSGRLWLWVGATLSFGTVAGAFLFSRIFEGVQSGLSNRVEYWKVALSVFKASPIVGTGLETYQNYFTAHRSIERAVSLEGSHADAAHSVPLGILSGGGFILSVTYLGVILVVGYYGVQAVRNAEGGSRQFFSAVLAAWFAYQIQSSVSMDVPGLVFTQWILGGILLAGGVQESRPALELPWSKDRSIGSRQWVMGGGLVVVFLIALGPLSAPMRADTAAYRAQKAKIAGNPELAVEELERATDLQPWNSAYLERLADLHEQTETNEVVFDERKQVARLKPGNAFAAVQVARAAIRLDRLDVAGQWFEHAVRQDPYGAGVLVEAAGFFAVTGNEEIAVYYLATFEALGSRNQSMWQVAGEIYDFLGEEEAARHAAACAESGEKGCWLIS